MLNRYSRDLSTHLWMEGGMNEWHHYVIVCIWIMTIQYWSVGVVKNLLDIAASWSRGNYYYIYYCILNENGETGNIWKWKQVFILLANDRKYYECLYKLWEMYILNIFNNISGETLSFWFLITSYFQLREHDYMPVNFSLLVG